MGLQRVPEADTLRMRALLGRRKHGLDLAGVSRFLVDPCLDIVQRGVDEGVNENEIVAWLWRAIERRVLRPADQYTVAMNSAW